MLTLSIDVASAYPADYYSYAVPSPGGKSRLRKLVLGAISRLSTRAWWRAAAPALFSVDQHLAAAYGADRCEIPPAVLDVGCGWGKALDVYKDRGFDTFGVELSASVARTATARGHKVFSADDEGYVRDRLFRVVRSSHTVEHVDDPLGTLATLAERLGEDGTLFVEVPNVTGLVARIFGRYWSQIDPPRHLAIPSRRALVARLEALGMCVTWDTYTYPKTWVRSLFLFAHWRGKRERRLLEGNESRAMSVLSGMFVVPSLLCDWLKVGDNLRLVGRRRP